MRTKLEHASSTVKHAGETPQRIALELVLAVLHTLLIVLSASAKSQELLLGFAGAKVDVCLQVLHASLVCFLLACCVTQAGSSATDGESPHRPVSDLSLLRQAV